MNKNALVIILSSTLWLSLSVKAELKTAVDAHIKQHGELMGSLADNVPYDRVQIGNGESIQGNIGLQHARTVSRLINDTINGGAQLMQACCWRPQPSVYPDFVSANTQELLAPIIGGASPLYNTKDRPNQYSNPADSGRAELPVTRPYSEYFASAFEQMLKIREGYSEEQIAERMDRFTYQWMSTLTAGLPGDFNFTGSQVLPQDSLLSRLIWNWSYQAKKYRHYRIGQGKYNPHPAAMQDGFRDYFNWACIVCAGAGFYDTTGMYDKDENGIYRANDYYYAIIGLLPEIERTWLQSQYDEGFKGRDGKTSAPPLQVSIGLTMQSQQNNAPQSDDITAVYGTHCHTATELYIPIDPMGFDKKQGNNILAGLPGYDIDTNSYMAGIPNKNNAQPVFGDFVQMQNQVMNDLQGSYATVKNGDVVFWDSRVNHSMFPGKRLQLAAWARMTRPYEGTVFPKDIDASLADGGDGTIDQQDGNTYATVCRDSPLTE